MYQANLMDFFSKNIAKTFQVKPNQVITNKKAKKNLLIGQQKLSSFLGKRDKPEATTRMTRTMSQKEGNEAQILDLNER